MKKLIIRKWRSFQRLYRFKLIKLNNFFNRLKKIAQDVAKVGHKEVEMEVKGDDIYLNRATHNEVVNSLIHLIRNAVDHGLEEAETRIANHKSGKGSIVLECLQKDKNIKIIVKDDGKGIDPQVIKTKALEKNLITKEAAELMTDEDALKLILQPGFSSTEEVTEISGRGVGMDVVNETVRKLSGTFDIQSEINKGTTFSISFSTEYI